MIDRNRISDRREPIATVIKTVFALRAIIPRNVDAICAGTSSRETKRLILFQNILKLRSFGSRINPPQHPRRQRTSRPAHTPSPQATARILQERSPSATASASTPSSAARPARRRCRHPERARRRRRRPPRRGPAGRWRCMRGRGRGRWRRRDRRGRPALIRRMTYKKPNEPITCREPPRAAAAAFSGADACPLRH
jgi:hypothetical protein